MTTNLKKLCEIVLEAGKKATKVQGWYAHAAGDACEEATIRGPFWRWFRVAEVDLQDKKHVADSYDDAKFGAIAMNSAEAMARALLVMEAGLKRYCCCQTGSCTSCTEIAKVEEMLGERWG